MILVSPPLSEWNSLEGYLEKVYSIFAAAVAFIAVFATDYLLRPYFSRSGAKHFKQ